MRTVAGQKNSDCARRDETCQSQRQKKRETNINRIRFSLIFYMDIIKRSERCGTNQEYTAYKIDNNINVYCKVTREGENARRQPIYMLI